MKSKLDLPCFKKKRFLPLQLWCVEREAGLIRGCALCLETLDRRKGKESLGSANFSGDVGSLHSFSEQKWISLKELELLIQHSVNVQITSKHSLSW